MAEYQKIDTIEEFNKLTTQTYDKSRRNIHVSGCDITFNIRLSESLNMVSFDNCIFTGTAVFSCTFEQGAEFKNVIFKKPATFDNSHFKSKSRFHVVTFEDTVSFDNARFYDLADFWGSAFHKPVIFYKTDFLGITVFSRTQFNENVLFTYTLVEKVVIFRGTNFVKGLDLSLSILNGNFNVFDVVLNDFKTKESFEDEDEYEDCISEQGIIPEKNKRETFKLLKTQLQNQGNKIDSLKYANLELTIYHKQLQREFFKEKKFKTHFENYFILALNTLSNKNGKSWLRGILFTLSIALILFYASILSTDRYYFAFNIPSWENINSCIKLYFEFLTPTHKIQLLDDLGSNAITYFWDFVSRIFIAYGIFQTIQAFRKFKPV